MTVNASACYLKILIGSDAQDWSKTLKSFDAGFPKRDRGGLLPITGQLVLIHWDYAPESMNPRLNPARWHRGQTINVQVSLDGVSYTNHPCGKLYILKEPVPPAPDKPELELQVGCILALRDYAEPDNDKSGVILGVPMSRTAIVANILAAANIPTPAGTVPLYPESHPLPKIGGSYVQQAGKVAYAGFKALYQDNQGSIQAVDLTLNPSATPVLSFAVGPGGGEILYTPSEGAETPVEELRVVGLDRIGIDTWRCLSSLPQESYQTTNAGSGAVTRLLRRTTITDCQGLDSNGFFYKSREEFVEETAGSVYPNDEPGSQRLTYSSDTTTTYYYEPGVTGRLLSIHKVQTRPFAAAVASFWGNLSATQKLSYSRISPTQSLDELTTFTYVDYPTPQDGSVADQYAFNYQAQVVTGQVAYSQAPVATLITDPTELASLASSPASLVPSGRTTESWAKVRGYEWQKTTTTEQPFITANPDGAALSTTLSAKIALVTTDQTTDVSAAGGQQPSAPERRPDRYTEMEIQIKGRALFGPISGTTEQKRFRSIEVEYMISNDQASAIAQMEGTILIGRRQGQTILTGLSSALLNNPAPLGLWQITEPDGTAYLYQADAIQYTHDENQAVVGCTGIWLATIPVTMTQPQLPYNAIMPMGSGLLFGGTITVYPYSLAPQTTTMAGGVRMGGQLIAVIQISIKGGLRYGGKMVAGPSVPMKGGVRFGGNMAFAGVSRSFAGGMRHGGNLLGSIQSAYKGGLRFGGSFTQVGDASYVASQLTGVPASQRQKVADTALAAAAALGGGTTQYNIIDTLAARVYNWLCFLPGKIYTTTAGTTLATTGGNAARVDPWIGSLKAQIYSGNTPPVLTASSGVTFDGSSTYLIMDTATYAIPAFFEVHRKTNATVNYNPAGFAYRTSSTNIKAGVSTSNEDLQLSHCGYSGGSTASTNNIYLAATGTIAAAEINGSAVSSLSNYAAYNVGINIPNATGFNLYYSAEGSTSGAKTGVIGADAFTDFVPSTRVLRGEVADFVILNATPSTTEKTRMTAFFKALWGIA